MIARLSKIQRQALALLLLLAAAAVFVSAVALPLVTSWTQSRDAIVQMEDGIARYARLSARIDALESAVEALTASEELDAFVLPQTSEPLAAAALQERVKSVVMGSGGTLTSTQVLPVAKEQGFKRIAVNVRMAGSAEALQRVLHELESGLPYLVADDVVILARGARKQRRQSASEDMLDVRFNLSGFMRDAGGAPA